MTGSNLPAVTVIVPALDEAADIAACIATVATQDYEGPIDVILVDAGSNDGTAIVAQAAADERAINLSIVDNVLRRTSIGLNKGLERAEGDVIVRLDARARIEPHYIRTCVECLRDEAVGVVGGAQIPVARSQRILDRSIARGLRNRFATGMSRYRLAMRSGPADTVWMGSFRRADLIEIGGWEEDVALNEDWELNARYRAAGFTVWFEQYLRSRYLPRPTFARLARQYFYFGRVKGMWWVRGMSPSPRQMVLLVAPVIIGAATLATTRRFGARVLLVVPAAALLVDHLGEMETADEVVERVGSAAAMATYVLSWWIGVVVGAMGEVAGVEHQHRPGSSGRAEIG